MCAKNLVRDQYCHVIQSKIKIRLIKYFTRIQEAAIANLSNRGVKFFSFIKFIPVKIRLSHILVLTIAFAFFLDTINIDDLFLSHIMDRDDTLGQSTGDDYSSRGGTVELFVHTTTHETTVRQFNTYYHPFTLVDEDSPSLPTHPAIPQEFTDLPGRNLNHGFTAVRLQSINFHFLHKLQI
jgi:hypothetical protein